jgi:nicotinate-nucleotide pyrophosphorylase (carboxylating)
VTREQLHSAVAAALIEDVGSGDLTTDAIVAPAKRCDARLVVKERGTVCGLEAAELAFSILDPQSRFEYLARDGDLIEDAPRIVARVNATTRAVLTGERTALNFVGRLSGIATLTSKYVRAVWGTGAVILDTRKTTPGLRALEKHAVESGGGCNHRFGLADGVLIKDNHLQAAGSISAAICRVRARTNLPVEVECESLEQVVEALEAKAEAVLLDNMALGMLREAVRLVAGDARVEASGGITLDTVRAVAETGVDEISVGALTHSASALDVSLELE